MAELTILSSMEEKKQKQKKLHLNKCPAFLYTPPPAHQNENKQTGDPLTSVPLETRGQQPLRKKVLSEEDFCTNQHFFCFSIPAIGFIDTVHIRLRHMINEVTDTGRGCLHISYNTWSSLNMSTHRPRTEERQLCFWATLALFILCTNHSVATRPIHLAVCF